MGQDDVCHSEIIVADPTNIQKLQRTCFWAWPTKVSDLHDIDALTWQSKQHLSLLAKWMVSLMSGHRQRHSLSVAFTP